MNQKIPHLIPTQRDHVVMKALSSLSVATSRTLRRISSPQSKYKTFLSRLSALKAHGFVRELYGNERLRNRHGIYALWNAAVVVVWFPELGNVRPVPSKSSRSNFKHRLLLGDFVADTLDAVIRKKDPSIVPLPNEMRGSDYMRSELAKWTKTAPSANASNYPIPDFAIMKWNRLFAFELQNRSGNRQLQNKVSNYRFLRIQSKAGRTFPLFDWKETVLAVGLRDVRKLSARKVMEWYHGKKFLKSIEDFE